MYNIYACTYRCMIINVSWTQQRSPEEGNPNEVHVVIVKTDATKTVQIKCNNDLPSFQLHFIINFVLTESKLTHGPGKFPVRSISHFVMNIIMAKTISTAKVNSAE